MILSPKLACLAVLLCGLSSTAWPEDPAAEPARPFGLGRRVPWTTSNFHGRPEPPPPYRAERVYSRLRFEHTTVLATIPGTDQMVVGEQFGKAFWLPRDRAAAKAELFLDCNRLVERFKGTVPGKVLRNARFGLPLRLCRDRLLLIREPHLVLEIANRQLISRVEVPLVHPNSINADAIGAAQIANHQMIVNLRDAAVSAGDFSRRNLNIAFLMAADQKDRLIQQDAGPFGQGHELRGHCGNLSTADKK